MIPKNGIRTDGAGEIQVQTINYGLISSLKSTKQISLESTIKLKYSKTI